MKLESSSKKEDKDSGTVETNNPNPKTKSPSDSKSYSRSRSRSQSASKSKSKSSKSRKSSEEKHPIQKPKKQKETKERSMEEEDKKEPSGVMSNFQNFMNPQPFNPKHLPFGQMQSGLFGPHYGAPFMPMGPLPFHNFFRPQFGPQPYYKPGYKKFAPDDNDKNAPNLLQNLGVGMGLKPLRFDKRGGISNVKGKKKNEEPPAKTKKSIEDVLVFKKFNSLPITTEIFLTVQAFLQYSDQNLYMNMSKKLLSDFEKKCKENKMKNLAKSLGRYLINFNEMIKKEKEKETKETKKKSKDGKNNNFGDEKDPENLNKAKDVTENTNKVKDFETIQWLHKNKNMQDLFNKVNLDSFKLEDFNFNILEKCTESKNIFEEAKELFLKKFKAE